MHIIKATDAIAVEHPVLLIFGQPGIGKTSLAYSAADPLVLDFDQGAHRAANRRDTLAISGRGPILRSSWRTPARSTPITPSCPTPSAAAST